MPASPTIQFVEHKNINKKQWDEIIFQADNALIYAHSFYLDAMAPGWNALMASDQSWGLPLTQRTKFGITYLYQPAFTQQLGVFAKNMNEIPWKEILQWLQQHYKFCEVQWNYGTLVENFLPGITTQTATNFVLHLSPGYEKIAANYSNDLQRNIKRGNRFNFKYSATVDYENCIETYQQHYGSRMPHVTDDDYAAFKNVCLYAAKNDMLYCRQLTNEEDELLSVALLLFDGKRLYNMMNTTTAAGRKAAANHVLFDSIIEEFSGRDLMLDFEGSDLPGVQAFYLNFHPVNQPFYLVRYNALPWPLKLLKR